MVSSELADYINKRVKEGYTKEQIRKALLGSGWPSQQVDEAIRILVPKQMPAAPAPKKNNIFSQSQAKQPEHKPVEQSPAEQKQPEKSLGLFSRFKMLIIHPNQFFERVKNENNYGPPIVFYLILSVFNIIFSILIFFIYPSIGSTQSTLYGMILLIGDPFLSYLISNTVSNMASIIFVFAGALFIHIFVLMFGGKKGYINTFKSIIYSSIATILFWIAVLLISVNFIITVLLIGVFFIWSVILQIKSLSSFHDISNARAFAILVMPVIISIGVLVFILFSAALFALGTFNPGTYTGSIPIGFANLGAPEEWVLDSNGDLSVVLSNRLPNSIEIKSIEVSTLVGSTTWETLNCNGEGTYFTIGAGSSAMPSASACPNSDMAYSLNVGSHTAGTTYIVDVTIIYSSGGMIDKTETGRLSGTVS
ncbi:MAG: YIP1 family protein [Deltaproteobacteria bacterium]|nr:YIP1 family protein [Deltaproteobacteria bacterium]